MAQKKKETHLITITRKTTHTHTDPLIINAL